MLKHINQISEQAFILDFGSEINMEINNFVLSFTDYLYSKIENNNFLEIKNCVPSYNKILIQFDPLSDSKSKILDFIYSINQKEIPSIINKKTIEIPICYDEEFALDIIDIEKKVHMPINDIITSHVSTSFYVYMIGFMPGLPFMGDLDKQLSVPRKLSPRLKVPAGSIGIVDKFCVIYPDFSPGGWNIIGRTPQKMFDKNNNHPTYVKPGYNVKFVSITKKQFAKLIIINE